MGVLVWESQCRAAMGWGRLQPQQALPGAEGAPQRREALTPAFQAVGFLHEGPGNQPQAGHWLVRLGTQASGIVSFLLRCPRDPEKGSAFRKSSPPPPPQRRLRITSWAQKRPEKGPVVLTETPPCTWGGSGSQGWRGGSHRQAAEAQANTCVRACVCVCAGVCGVDQVIRRRVAVRTQEE